jgi:hypothetical protein
MPFTFPTRHAEGSKKEYTDYNEGNCLISFLSLRYKAFYMHIFSGMFGNTYLIPPDEIKGSGANANIVLK